LILLPINFARIVRGTLSILVGLNEKLSPKANEQIADAVDAADRLEAILHDILLANELAGGTPRIRPDRVNLNQLLSEQISKLKSNAKAKNLRIVYRKPRNTLCEILAHPRLVTVAISNSDDV
jgi:signal transduction histidine kinase